MAKKIQDEENRRVEADLGGLGGDRGNTQNPIPRKEPLQVPKRKNHFFTINNYTEDIIGGLLEYFDKHAKKYAFQEEIAPSTGTPHLQGMVMFNTEKRSTTWDPKSLGHYEPLKITDGVYQLKEETRKPDGRQWTKGLPKPLKLITPDKWWQLEILKIIEEEPDDRAVYWYWSENGGIGKSQFSKYLLAKHGCVFIDEGKKADIMYTIMEADMDEKNCIIFDIPRDNGNKVSYKSIESIKNGMIYSPKYESGYKLFNSPHIIIFANEPPDQSKLSNDRWNIKKID